jgi:hypothetical protein
MRLKSMAHSKDSGWLPIAYFIVIRGELRGMIRCHRGKGRGEGATGRRGEWLKREERNGKRETGNGEGRTERGRLGDEETRGQGEWLKKEERREKREERNRKTVKRGR